MLLKVHTSENIPMLIKVDSIEFVTTNDEGWTVIETNSRFYTIKETFEEVEEKLTVV